MKFPACFGCGRGGGGGGYTLEKFTCGQDVPKASRDVAAVERYKDKTTNYVSKWGIDSAKILCCCEEAVSGCLRPENSFFFCSAVSGGPLATVTATAGFEWGLVACLPLLGHFGTALALCPPANVCDCPLRVAAGSPPDAPTPQWFSPLLLAAQANTRTVSAPLQLLWQPNERDWTPSY